MKVGSIVEKIKGNRPKDPTSKRDLAVLKAHGFIFPVDGQTYTVRTLENGGIHLEEIVNTKFFIDATGRWEEPTFCVEMFRELLPPQPIEELIGDALTAPIPNTHFINNH